jgi:hypothetical protein
MRSVRWSALPLLALLAACESPAAPALADGAQPFDPPPVYQLWWSMVRECSGRSAPLSSVSWYVVPGANTVEVEGERYAGYWSSSGNAIVLAEAAMLDGPLVRHEMLHSLVQDAGHARRHFLERCGGVVVCERRCVAEAEPLPPVPASMPRVGPDVLDVGIVVSTTAPSLASHGGYFTVTVTAHNPWNNPIVVRLPPPGDNGPSVSFRYEFAGGGGAGDFADRAFDDGVTRFAPGETKRRVYDFHVVGPGESPLNGGLQPGTYQFRGAYGDNWSAASATVVVP